MGEKEKKVCPFLLGKKDKPYCVEDRCGWWNYRYDTCSISILGSVAMDLDKVATGQQRLKIQEN